MKIQHVELAYVNQTWPLVEDYISSALEHGQDDYTVEQVKVFVTTGQWTLLVATEEGQVKGAAAINFFNRPNHRVAFVVCIGGRLISNEDTFKQFKNILVMFGATYIEGAARESIARLWTRYGFTEKYRIVGVQI